MMHILQSSSISDRPAHQGIETDHAASASRTSTIAISDRPAHQGIETGRDDDGLGRTGRGYQ